jgi:hypothetical protein
MKAVLALIVIYIGTFLVAIQGASNSPVEASEQNAAETPKTLDPAKEADIRSLLELAGAKDSLEDAAGAATEAYRQKVVEASGPNDPARASSSALLADFRKRFDTGAVQEQMVQIYGRHFSQEEIRGLLEFYGSPLGQKAASEMPKIAREIQFAARAAGQEAARQARLDLRAESARPGAPRRPGLAARRGAEPQAQAQQADASQP